MFSNPFRSQKIDPFLSLETNNAEEHFTISDIKTIDNFHNLENSDIHTVKPHYVNSYIKKDGTYIDGYWRDGDGDSLTNDTFDLDGGYLRTDPDYSILNNIG